MQTISTLLVHGGEKKFEVGRKNRSKQHIRSTSGSKAHFEVRVDMAKELGREPSLKEWWYKTHTQKDQWSTSAAQEVYDQYEVLFGEKYKDVEKEKQPPFDAALWKMVLDGRDVGLHSAYKQALGGLDPNFHSASSYSSNIYTSVASVGESTPSSTQYVTMEYIDSKLASLSQSISQELKGFLDLLGKEKQMVKEDEEEYETKTDEDDFDKHYYE